MERRHPRPFRRIGLNGHDVAPSRIQPTSKHALKYLFSTVSTIPSSRVEGPFQGNFRLPNCRRIFIVLPFIVYLLLFIFPLVLFPLYSHILIEILKIIINILRFFSLRVSNGALNSLDLFSSFSCYYYFYRCVIIFAEKILPSQYLKCRFFFLCTLQMVS